MTGAKPQTDFGRIQDPLACLGENRPSGNLDGMKASILLHPQPLFDLSVFHVQDLAKDLRSSYLCWKAQAHMLSHSHGISFSLCQLPKCL